MSGSNLFGERDSGEDLISIVNDLVASIESHPVHERRELLLAPALLGKAIAMDSLRVIVKDFSFEEFSSDTFHLRMNSIISDGITHLLKIALITLPNSDATWECAIDESTQTLKLGRFKLGNSSMDALGGSKTYEAIDLLGRRILQLEKIIPVICYEFAKSNGRFMPLTPGEAAWQASMRGRHTSGLRRTERREQIEDGEYETGIPWTKSNPYSPE